MDPLVHYKIYFSYNVLLTIFLLVTFTYITYFTWVLYDQTDTIPEEADEGSVSRHLEAYLLWLFGWVMFMGMHGSSMNKHMINYARHIA